MASKELARAAARALHQAASMLDCIEDKKFVSEVKRKLVIVDNFIDAAESRLPTQAAIDRDKQRRAKKA